MRPLGVPGAGPERPDDDRPADAWLVAAPIWRILGATWVGLIAWVALCYAVSVGAGWLLRALFGAQAVTP